jgi:hypothetical protein
MNELVVSDESIVDSTNADDRIVSKSLPNESKRRLSSNVFSDVISNRLMDTTDYRIDHRNSPNRRRVNSSDSLKVHMMKRVVNDVSHVMVIAIIA